MPELYLKARELFCAGELEKARQVQNECCLMKSVSGAASEISFQYLATPWSGRWK